MKEVSDTEITFAGKWSDFRHLLFTLLPPLKIVSFILQKDKKLFSFFCGFEVHLIMNLDLWDNLDKETRDKI